jgi:hypothetical protein
MTSSGSLQDGCAERHDVRFRKRRRCLLRVIRVARPSRPRMRERRSCSANARGRCLGHRYGANREDCVGQARRSWGGKRTAAVRNFGRLSWAHVGCGVNRVDLRLSEQCPLFPRNRRKSGHAGRTGSGQCTCMGQLVSSLMIGHLLVRQGATSARPDLSWSGAARSGGQGWAEGHREATCP